MIDPGQSSVTRVVVAGAKGDRVRLAELMQELGHTVFASVPAGCGLDMVVRGSPDVVLVSVGANPAATLELTLRIVQRRTCPVIAVVREGSPAVVETAAAAGAFACVVDLGSAPLRAALAVALRRFDECHRLRAAFGRRAVIERAKGILMERHRIGEEQAFALLREQARPAGRKLVDIAGAVVDSHRLAAPPGELSLPAPLAR